LMTVSVRTEMTEFAPTFISPISVNFSNAI
jgi:hypothetical protein